MSQQTELQELIRARFEALKIKDPQIRAEVLALVNLKATRLQIRKQTVQAQLDSIQLEKRIEEMKERRVRAEADRHRARTADLQEQIRSGKLTLRNGRSWT